MTRYTNFARKRAYVQAGFDNEPKPAEMHENALTATPAPSGDAAIEPETKKRKRGRSKKTKFSDTDNEHAAQPHGGEDVQEGGEQDEGPSERPVKKSKFANKDKTRKTFDKHHPKGIRHIYMRRIRTHRMSRCQCSQVSFRTAETEANRR